MPVIYKLIREGSVPGEHEIGCGECTIGRGVDNKIILNSIVVSRHHCVVNVDENGKVTVKDLKSSNGTYVGPKKIPQETFYPVKLEETIGIGWTTGGTTLEDRDKVIFKLCPIGKIEKESDTELSFSDESMHNITENSKIIFKPDPIEERLLNHNSYEENQCIELETNLEIEDILKKPNRKRKLGSENQKHKIKSVQELKSQNKEKRYSGDVVSLLTDSDNDDIFNFHLRFLHDDLPKKAKIEPENIQVKQEVQIKIENDVVDGETAAEILNVKEEHFFDEDPIQVDSDSESETWFLRLSQSSPGKPFMKRSVFTKTEKNDISQEDDDEEDIISFPSFMEQPQQIPDDNERALHDEVDSSFFSNHRAEEEVPEEDKTEKSVKKAIMIEPSTISPKRISHYVKNDKKSSRRSKKNQDTSSSSKVADQKEERRKKLKELASKNKINQDTSKDNTTPLKPKVSAKISSSNRGAFLTETAIVKPMQREKDKPKRDSSASRDKKAKGSIAKSNDDMKMSTSGDKKDKDSKAKSKDSSISDSSASSDTKAKRKSDLSASSNKKDKDSKAKSKDLLKPEKKSKETKSKHKENSNERYEKFTPTAIVKPLTDCENVILNIPVVPIAIQQQKKAKKSVRFSSEPPEIRLFQIEPGNQLKKTSLCQTALLSRQKMPIFSLEKKFLMMILRWTPRWLDEQMGNDSPPPILPHSKPPMALCHAFSNHTEYVSIVGDLLLMEIWECLTQAYMKKRNQDNVLELRLESPPPVHTDFHFGTINLSVNLSLPKADTRALPRLGELMLISFGTDKARSSYFFYVHNVRCLPSPSSNRNNFYSISLSAFYTDKMKNLRLGEVMLGKTLSYIKNELSLMEAMGELTCSPLSHVILKPEPEHFVKVPKQALEASKSQWTKELNESQLEAVESSVSAALSATPSIQMIQGPPGTGKSSVICSIVMRYFYDMTGHRQSNRGKILICATSNAAVDELVIRLLNIRQTLPKNERFRMVRVGRTEAMHPRARDVSSHVLAVRDAQRALQDPSHRLASCSDEIATLEARVNSWRCSAENAKDSGRAAYCQSRIALFTQRLNQLRISGHAGPQSGEPTPQHVSNAERRVIEGADIVVTTLSSAANQKLKCLKSRIALCIIDEAGQAIEPETLIPLTLNVTKLTLIGDPRQLPGYICSQRAKDHGLGESLFSRLSSITEDWSVNPVILLNVQYRMHPEIADYPNKTFYEGMVHNSHKQIDLGLPPYSMIFISSGDRGQANSGANEMEAWGVTRLVLNVVAMARQRNASIAVITPYNAHKDMIRRYLKNLQPTSDPPIEVNTIDSFQGQERDIIVVSLARSNGVGFLTDAGRMNVLLTRAKHSLLICLNPQAMMKNDLWRTLIEDARRRNRYKYLPNHVCQPIAPEKVPKDDVLRYLRS